MAVRIANTTQSPYLIKKHTQIKETSVVTPEQSEHIKPVDMAILNMIPPGNPDLDCLTNFSEKINPSSKTIHSGSQHLKIMEILRITPQYTPQSSKN